MRYQSLGKRDLFALTAILAPLFLYALIAIHTSVNIPYQDDFDSIGIFVERFGELHSFWAKLVWVVTAQHVQYKLIFLQTVCVFQYLLTGSTNYRLLQLLGDLSMPLLALLLWLILARSKRPLGQRLWLFIIPAWLILAICYAETINWAMSGLQNMAVVPFAVATLYFATNPSRHSFPATMALLALTICTSGNGFFLAIVLIYLLLRSGRIRHALITVGCTAAIAAIYFTRYEVITYKTSIAVADAIRSFVIFPFVFLGNAANFEARAFGLGLVLVAVFVFLSTRGWRKACPASFGAALFCLVTALGVTATRYQYGPGVALFGHYGMYSLLLITAEYLGVLRLFGPPLFEWPYWRAGLTAGAIASVLLCLSADYHGYRYLHARQRDMATHLILWQRHPDHLVLVPDENPDIQKPEWIPLRLNFQEALEREIRKGLYFPPYSASDQTPSHPHTPATRGLEGPSTEPH